MRRGWWRPRHWATLRQIVQVQPLDLGPGGHKGLHRHIAQAEDVFDHLLLGGLKRTCPCALLEQELDLLFANGDLLLRPHTEKAQDQVRLKAWMTPTGALE